MQLQLHMRLDVLHGLLSRLLTVLVAGHSRRVLLLSMSERSRPFRTKISHVNIYTVEGWAVG